MGWSLREPAPWRVGFLLFVVLLFTLVGGVARPGGTTAGAALAASLAFTATIAVGTSYPFIFPLVSVLVTLAIVIQRRSGGLAALQAQGLRRWEILTAYSLAVFLLALIPAFLAFLVLPPIVEPALGGQGQLGLLYPPDYWIAMPRLFMATLFTVLFAATFAILIRNPAVAFGAMVTFFFIGWYLRAPLGRYGPLTPPGAFQRAYRFELPNLEGLPFHVADLYVAYIVVAVAAFVLAVLYASRRGEML